MKRKIKVYFTDFWEVFKIEDNLFLDFLRQDYDVVIDAKSPDFLFYSVFGTKHYRYNCVKIFYTGENIRPNLSYADWAFTFDYNDSPRHFRLPLYIFFDDIHKLLVAKDIDKIIGQNRKFCNFVYSNASQPVRNRFFQKLSKYKHIDSAGRLYNNTSFRAKNKVDFVKDYKFTIAFENESYPGYTTEKIFEPMLVGSIPIYWGNPLVHQDFNRNSFINYFDFQSEEEMIERIIQIDQDDSLYAQILAEPFFTNNVPNQFVDFNKVREHLRMVIDSNIHPISSTSFPHKTKSQIMKKSYYFLSDLNYYKNDYYVRLKKANLTKLKIKIQRLFDK